jgi:hypothetical protein
MSSGLQTSLHLIDHSPPHINLELELMLQWRLRGIHESQVLLHLLDQGFHSGQIIAECLILIILVLIILACQRSIRIGLVLIRTSRA